MKLDDFFSNFEQTLDVSPVKTPRTTTISLSHKKLSSPFRSPLMKASSTPSVPSQASLSSQQTTLPGTFPISKTANTTTPAKPKQVIRLRPPPATPSKSASPLKKPFRSPLSKSMSSSSTLTVSTPSVRVLEAQLRVLKQACKIKADK